MLAVLFISKTFLTGLRWKWHFNRVVLGLNELHLKRLIRGLFTFELDTVILRGIKQARPMGAII